MSGNKFSLVCIVTSCNAKINLMKLQENQPFWYPVLFIKKADLKVIICNSNSVPDLQWSDH